LRITKDEAKNINFNQLLKLKTKHGLLWFVVTQIIIAVALLLFSTPQPVVEIEQPEAKTIVAERARLQAEIEARIVEAEQARLQAKERRWTEENDLQQLLPEKVKPINNKNITTIERYPTIEFRDKVKVEQEFTVQVSLTEDSVTPQVKIQVTPDKSAGVHLTTDKQLSIDLPNEQDSWEIEATLSVDNKAFEIIGKDTIKIILPREGDSTVARFKLIPKTIQEPKKVQKIRVTLWHEGTYLAKLERNITVINNSTNNHLRMLSTPIKPIYANNSTASKSKKSKRLENKEKKLKLSIDLKSPDMTIYLEHQISRISINSKFLQRLAGNFSRPTGLSKWLNNNYKKVAIRGKKTKRTQQEIDKNIALLTGFGRQLYNKFAPQEFKTIFWKLKDKLGDEFNTIHIFTDDPMIPWELMIPNRDGQELNFLGVDFQIARWHINNSSNQLERPSQFTNLQELLAIIPKYSDNILASARNELKTLKKITGFRQITGNYASVGKIFKTSANDNNIIHFIGHGTVQNIGQNLFNYAIKLEDSELDLMTFRGMIPHPPKIHPFFFFNACDIGQAHHVANFVDGWAPAVLEAGASGYIGGLWPLSNQGATKFAEQFYQKLEQNLATGQPANVAEILRQTRKQFYKNGDPTFLGYVYYGDPHFRFVREKTDMIN